MKLCISVSPKQFAAALLSMALVFAVGATLQGKGQKDESGSNKNSAKQSPSTPDVPSDSRKRKVSKAPSVYKKRTVSKASSVSRKRSVSKVPNVSKYPTVTKVPSVSKVPNVPGGGSGSHQSCLESCNSLHKTDTQSCRGRTGQDRASCQRSINEQHRLCIQSCPK
jgi:hypothetical protein